MHAASTRAKRARGALHNQNTGSSFANSRTPLLLDMNRKCLLVALGMALLVQPAIGKTVVKRSSDDDDDFFEFVGAVIDVVNVCAFVFAGGPEEVVPRLAFLAVTVLVGLLIAFLCAGCCGDDYDDHYHHHRKSRSRDGALRWGFRGLTSYNVFSELAENSNRWGF